jgi:hypothetical protein
MAFERAAKKLRMGVKGLWKRLEKCWEWAGDVLATRFKGV